MPVFYQITQAKDFTNIQQLANAIAKAQSIFNTTKVEISATEQPFLVNQAALMAMTLRSLLLLVCCFGYHRSLDQSQKCCHDREHSAKRHAPDNTMVPAKNESVQAGPSHTKVLLEQLIERWDHDQEECKSQYCLNDTNTHIRDSNCDKNPSPTTSTGIILITPPAETALDCHKINLLACGVMPTNPACTIQMIASGSSAIMLKESVAMIKIDPIMPYYSHPQPISGQTPTMSETIPSSESDEPVEMIGAESSDQPVHTDTPTVVDPNNLVAAELAEPISIVAAATVKTQPYSQHWICELNIKWLMRFYGLLMVDLSCVLRHSCKLLNFYKNLKRFLKHGQRDAGGHLRSIFRIRHVMGSRWPMVVGQYGHAFAHENQKGV
uniref:Uncharacterized protein n=1 Tax=Romanomermis culicivorax TaxID=13658 RepID=A0A915KGR2_ROMCU